MIYEKGKPPKTIKSGEYGPSGSPVQRSDAFAWVFEYSQSRRR